MKREVSAKEVLTSDEWIVSKVSQGYNGVIRVDARRRFYKGGEINFFSEWIKKTTAKKYLGRELKITHF